MDASRSALRDKLLEEIEELPEEQLADVALYVDRLRADLRKQRKPGQGLDARGLEIIWRCTDCGYVQARVDKLPDTCPSCGSPKEAFVLVEED